MVRGPPVVLEICPCGPSKKYRRKIKIQMNCWKSQGLEMTHGNRLSLFSQYWHFMKFITLPIYRLPTLLSGTKEVFEALSMWCFSPSFPYTSGDAPVTQPETIRIHNKGPEYRIFSCIYDILNSFVADSWRKRLDARLPPLGPEFTSRSLHVGFVVDETGSG